MRTFSIQIAVVSVSALLTAACASKSNLAEPTPAQTKEMAAMTDPNVWLETSADPTVMKWVQDHNAKSLRVLEADSRFKAISDEARAIITAKDRLAVPTQHGKMVRNFWQDQTHQRGYIRQTPLTDYLRANPQWETILDIDELNKKEGKSWVYKGQSCLAPDDDLCLMSLSDGGRDEVVVREFQVSTKSFVDDGFRVPPAKTHVSWIDRSTVFISTDFGPGSLTTSGYPLQVRVWKRGTALANAKIIFSGKKSDVSVRGWNDIQPGSSTMYISQGVSFFEERISIFDGTKMTAIPFPPTAAFEGEFKGQLLAMLRSDWKTSKKTYRQGSVVSVPLASVGASDAESKIETVYEPDDRSCFTGFSRAKDYLVLSLLNNVRGELRQVTRSGDKWITQPVKLPSSGTVSIVDANTFSNEIFVTYQTYNVPTSLYYGSGDFQKPLKKIKSLPDYFKASDIVVEQHEAVSPDGTKIPYFVVHKKSIKLDGSNPTLLSAYGGFEISETPIYSGVIGKVWLEKGGIYAVANIRGGGEFGPRWHEAALKENRQRAYDDFASVSQDLINRKITSPRRLGIQGGSNGGLLVGVAMTQHPELYNAVICESALLDMIRFTQMPPGASWIGEYGDPADEAAATYISKYSPYQNVRAGAVYPEAFFHISTADDRVQPGHTRKMVARLEQMNHPVLFFENTEGGHGGAADPEQSVHKIALEFTYLAQKLID